MIDPKEIEIDGRTYIISKFPAIDGREIICKYGLSSLPKIGEYAINHEMMLKLFHYVAVKIKVGAEDREQKLSTKELINNHVKSWESVMKIEMAMLEYNCTFFQDGRVSTFFEGIAQKLPPLITKILTDSLAQLSAKEKPPSTN